MPQQASQSLISIDIARAIAALGVFYFHMHIGGVLANYSGINWLNFTDVFGQVYAVPLFFLISGYCIHLSNIKYIKAGEALPIKEYYKRRLLRIYPPYLAALLFSIAINFITRSAYHISSTKFLVHLFLLQGFSARNFITVNVALWTISIELALYILYPLFFYLRRKFSLAYALLFALIVSCASIAYFSAKSNILLAELYCVFNIWFAWCCGAYLADKKVLNSSDLKKPVYKVIYAAIFVVFFLLKTTGLSKFLIINYQFNILIWTAPLLFLLDREKWFSGLRSPIIKILAAIGLSSYSLYLLHVPLIALKNFCAQRFMPTGFQSLAVFAGILIIPVVTWFSYKYIERPFMTRKPEPVINA